MQNPQRAWYDRPGPVFVLIGCALVLAFATSVGWYTFNYYRMMRSGGASVMPQYLAAFTPSRIAKAAAAGKIPDVNSADAPFLGNPDAEVTIVEFGDYECEYTKEEYPTIRTLALERKDVVKYVWRDYPLEDIHPTAKAAAVAASCAGRSGRYWQMQDKLFANQGSFSRDDLAGYAGQIGLGRDDFLKCLDAGGDKERIAADIAAGTKAVIRGTPTLFVNGARIEGAVPYEILKQIVDRLVK